MRPRQLAVSAPPAGPGQGGTPLAVDQQFRHSIGEGLVVIGIDDHAGVAHQLGHVALTGRHDRQPGGQVVDDLQRTEVERLDRPVGSQPDQSTGQQACRLPRWLWTSHLDAVGHAETTAFGHDRGDPGTAADDPEPQRESPSIEVGQQPRQPIGAVPRLRMADKHERSVPGPVSASPLPGARRLSEPAGFEAIGQVNRRSGSEALNPGS